MKLSALLLLTIILVVGCSCQRTECYAPVQAAATREFGESCIKPAAGPADSAKRHVSTAQLLHEAYQHLASKQCYPFSLQHSIARDDFEYPSLLEGGRRRRAKKGELIELRCDSVICPNPRVPDCYMQDGVCGADQWCNLEDQVRFGPWAMVPSGETPNVGLSVDCKYYKRHGYEFIYQQVCMNHTNWGPWKPVRGKCQAYRREQQSCNAYFAATEPGAAPYGTMSQAKEGSRSSSSRSDSSSDGGSGSMSKASHEVQQADWLDSTAVNGVGNAEGTRGGVHSRRQLSSVESYHSNAAKSVQGQQTLWPQYVVDDRSGRPPARPLLCAPGLVCTGDVDPTPHTCVKIRPPNVCYQGPWWDSTSWCKVGSNANNKHYGGLPLSQLQQAAQALLIQLPTEVFGNPNMTDFWNSSAADIARGKIQRILQVLWPEVYRTRTTFPLALPDPRTVGHPNSRAWNRTAAEAAALYRQSNKVWSTIHTLVHNCKDPMSSQQVRASRSLAVWLRQHFMCCNCRGMWANYVLNVIGLPPKSSSREEHKLWWWRAHNMVSEHSAASRGGHPWVYSAQPDERYAKQYEQYGGHLTCQNPFFLPLDFIDDMWDIDESVAALD